MRRLIERPRHTFLYRNDGDLAAVGRKSAIEDFGRMFLNGLSNRLAWDPAHIFFAIGLRGCVMVMFSSPWFYLTTEHDARLMAGSCRKLSSDGRSQRTVGFDMYSRAHDALAPNWALRGRQLGTTDVDAYL